jgi:hypothetical protein
MRNPPKIQGGILQKYREEKSSQKYREEESSKNTGRRNPPKIQGGGILQKYREEESSKGWRINIWHLRLLPTPLPIHRSGYKKNMVCM